MCLEIAMKNYIKIHENKYLTHKIFKVVVFIVIMVISVYGT